MHKLIFSLFFLSLTTFSALAVDTYQTATQFIDHAFDGQKPKAKAVWLTSEDKKTIADIMSRSYKKLRIRYWLLANETVWIIDEIGKEKPITIGVHIKEKQIAELKVLTYRESRGDEVRHKFFTRQFDAVELTKENKLTQHIDGITGATMSVRALSKVARLSLWLNNKVQYPANN